jgi:dipeptidyl aminopeptidase/acylaminoacyl peptidase
MRRSTIFGFSFAVAILLAPAAAADKRPLTHADYDGWKHIQNQKLSDNGEFLAYALFPQQGDGELVVRNLKTGKEIRETIGQLPPPPAPDFSDPTAEAPTALTRNVTLSFTRDGRTLVCSTFPTKAEVDQAKRDKKTTGPDSPKNGMRIVDLTTGNVIRVARVKSFQVPARTDGLVAYLKEGGELVLRNLASGADRTVPDVTEFSLTKDGKLLAYAVSSKPGDSNGVYAASTAGDTKAKALLSGKGRYSKLTWNQAETALAFYAGASSAGAKLYLWTQGTEQAAELVSAQTPGFPASSIISERSAIAFSRDGKRVFFGYAPKPAPPKKDDTPAEDRVSVDLWHWKDDYIQPMQKVRAAADRNRSYRADYSLSEKNVVILGDTAVRDILPGEDSHYSLGGDDHSYRSMIEYDERWADTYLVDNLSGERKLLAKKHVGRVTWSPDSRYALYFDGKDWQSISVPDGKTTNLTARLPAKFWTEENDRPNLPGPYGEAGWLKDGKSVLLYDHFDIWQISPDGRDARMLTQGAGRQRNMVFRYTRLDSESRSIDPAKPLILRAENNDTHESGYFETSIGATAPPKQLVYGPKNFANLAKAKNVDVYVLTASTFRDAPDLQITDSTFRELRKVSDANPQQAGILWGSAELVHYRNTNGVPLSGILYKPEGFDAHKKYPMIVYIYERLTQGLFNYVEPRPMHSINISYYVSNGYLVLEPDIVYQVGYPGQSALNCVLPAVQSVVNQGFVNEDAIGIQGHSWGGYQIAFMITQTNRFKAVAAGAPVANMTSAYDGIRWGPGIPRQFQYERTQSRIGGSLWQYPMRFIENSPIFMVDRVKTPVLMIHNDADDAVPWYQGIEFYLGLRRLGKEVYLFSYNGEPHGLRRRPNQKDYAMRLQQYFDYYLKGAAKPDWMAQGIPYLEKPGAVISAAAENEQ